MIYYRTDRIGGVWWAFPDGNQQALAWFKGKGTVMYVINPFKGTGTWVTIENPLYDHADNMKDFKSLAESFFNHEGIGA
jgi:hypothetical protein